jgi:hypothetical protein
MGRRPHHGRHHGRGPRPTRARGTAAGRPAVQGFPGAPAVPGAAAVPVEAPAPSVEASPAIESIEGSPSAKPLAASPAEALDLPSPAVEPDPVEPDPIELVIVEPVAQAIANATQIRRAPVDDVAVAAGATIRPDGRESGGGGCTTSQLRRFIRSRPYVPMHELRRRFALNGGEDDVAGVEVDGRRVYVGLPEREGRMLGELLRGGEVGYELSLDPVTPVVVGVYPMRPVART